MRWIDNFSLVKSNWKINHLPASKNVKVADTNKSQKKVFYSLFVIYLINSHQLSHVHLARKDYKIPSYANKD